MEGSKSRSLLLFDLDGTLTKPRQVIDPAFRDYLTKDVSRQIDIGIVGGSDLVKISEQIGGPEVIKNFHYVFSENGLVALKKGEVFAKQSIVEFLGEDQLQEFINFCLEYMSRLTLPMKRGTFIEYRTGMINISPIGRNCSQKERDAFDAFDKENQIRAKFIESIKNKFPVLNLQYAIGGQISFDVYPTGWDKSYCLRYLEEYDNIYFFGDKCFPGGNDYEIFIHPRIKKGFEVTGPESTKEYIDGILKAL